MADILSGCRYETEDFFFDYDNGVFRTRGEEAELNEEEIKVLRMLTDNEGITIDGKMLAMLFWKNTMVVDRNRLYELMKILSLKVSAGTHLKADGAGYVWIR